MRHRSAFAMFALIAALRSAAANAPSDYAYVFPIETAAVGTTESSAWRVELTPEVYRWTQDTMLRDLEIFNADGRPVPVARIAVEPVATSREQSAELPALELPAAAKSGSASDLRLVIDRDASGRLRRIDAGEGTSAPGSTRDWLIDANGFERAIDGLALSWREPASGVVARFAVDASDDLEHWRGAGSATVLVLEQQGARIERRDVALAGVRAKYLRLHRLDDGAALQGLHVRAHATEHARAMPARAWIVADSVAPTGDAAAPGTTRFEYGLPAALPVDTARIDLSNDNALAPISLFAREPATASWLRIGGITAFRLREGDETLSNGDIDVGGARRLSAFRIESTTAIAVPPRLEVGYRPDSLVFLAEGSGPFVLAAGSLRARRADYPVDAALATLRAKLGKDWQPPPARLGPARASAGAAALRAPSPPLPWRRWLLWVVLIGGALLIVGFSISLLRGEKPPS